MHRSFSDPVVASNLPLFVAGAGFFFSKRKAHALILIASALASCLYHLSSEKAYLTIDKCLARLAFASSVLMLCTHKLAVGTRIGLVCDVFAAFYSLEKAAVEDYSFWHTSWHALVVLGQFLLLFDSLSDRRHSRSTLVK